MKYTLTVEEQRNLHYQDLISKPDLILNDRDASRPQSKQCSIVHSIHRTSKRNPAFFQKFQGTGYVSLKNLCYFCFFPKYLKFFEKHRCYLIGNFSKKLIYIILNK